MQEIKMLYRRYIVNINHITPPKSVHIYNKYNNE